MKKKLLAISFLTLSPLLLLAQIVSGKVSDVEGQPVPFAHVALLRQADSTIVAGMATDDKGTFKIKVNDSGNVFLRVSCVGYQPRNVAIGTSPLTVTLSPLALDEVTVEADRIKKNAISEVYYITDSLRRNSMNVLQLLNRLQGVKIDWVTDAVKIGEHRDVPMMVEGRETTQEYIRNLNPTRIRRVEILRYPKGKYGDAPIVLNIVLNNSYTGFDFGTYAKGMVSLKNKHSHHENGGITFTYATRKWNLYGEAEVKDRRAFEATAYEQMYRDASEITSIEKPGSPNRSESLSLWNASIGIDYKITPDHTLSVQTWADYSEGRDKETYMDMSRDFLSRSENDYDASNVTSGVFYKGEVNGKLHLSGDMTYNHYQVDEDKQYRWLSDVSGQLYEGMKDFWRVNADAQYVWSDRVSSTLGYTFTDKGYKNYSREDNRCLFSSKESRHNAYLNIFLNPNQYFNLVLGSNFMYIKEKEDTQSDSHFSWMPLAKVYWKPFKLISVSANYFCDVQHPNLDQQSTVAYQRNAFLWHKGNPALKANVMHYMECRLELKDIVRFTYLYKYSFREITPWYLVELDRVAETQVNGRYIHQYAGLSGDYTLPHNIGINFTANYQWYKRRAESDCSWRNGHTWYLDVTAMWQPHKYVSLMSGYFLRYDKEPLLQGKKYGQEEQLMVGAGTRLFKNRLSAMLVMTIPTQAISKRTYSKVDIPDYHYATWNNHKVNNAIIQLSLRYNIGKGKASRSKNANNSETEK